MPQDNFRKLYDNVKQGYDLPDYDTFKKDMENEDNLRKFHTNLEKEYELPDFDTFKSDMGLKKKETFGLGFGTASDASALTRPQAKVPFKSPSGSALEGIKGVKGDKPKAVIRPKSIVPIKEQESLPTENVPYKEDLQKRINVLNEKFGTDYDVEGALAEMDAPDIGTAEAAGRGFLSGVNSVFAATLNTPEYLRRVLTTPIMELAGMSEEGKQLFFDTQANNPVDPLYALNKISDIYKKDSEALVKPLEGKFDKDFMAQYEEGDYLGAAKQIGVDLAKSLPTTLAISMATAAGVPMSAMTPVGSLVFASQEYQSADPNSPMTETQKQTNSFLKGFSEQFFENLGTSQITKQALNLIKKEGADKAKSIIANQYATAAKESLKPYFALTAPLQEGLTEAATALAQNVIDKYTDPSKENINILQDVPKSFVMGAAMGTAFGAAPTIVNTAYSIKGKAAAKEAQEKISAIEQDLDNPNLGDNAKKILVEERAKALIEVNNVLEQEVEAVANLPEQQKEAVIEAQNQIADIDKALADETVSEPTKAAFEEKKTQIEQEIDAIITEQETEEAPSSETVTDTIVSDGSATPTTVESTEVAPQEEVVSETVSQIEPPVVEQTTTDVGGVTAPDVSEALKDVESLTSKAKELSLLNEKEQKRILDLAANEATLSKQESQELSLLWGKRDKGMQNLEREFQNISERNGGKTDPESFNRQDRQQWRLLQRELQMVNEAGADVQQTKYGKIALQEWDNYISTDAGKNWLKNTDPTSKNLQGRGDRERYENKVGAEKKSMGVGIQRGDAWYKRNSEKGGDDSFNIEEEVNKGDAINTGDYNTIEEQEKIIESTAKALEGVDENKLSQILSKFVTETQNEYIEKQKKEMGNLYSENMLGELKNEYFNNIEQTIKNGGKISLSAYNSLDGGQKYTFDKRYGKSKIGGETLYHSTNKEFDSFDLSKSGTTTDNGWWGKGVYFFKDKKSANDFSLRNKNSVVKTATVNLKNPLVLENESLPKNAIEAFNKRGIKAETIWDIQSYALDDMNKNPERITEILMSLDYDGIHLDLFPNKEVVVFNTSSIDKPINEAISEAYHKAKADDSNPELVKAVEELLGTESTRTENVSKNEPKIDTKAQTSESARKSENLAVSEREKEIQLLDTKKKIAQLEKELRKAPTRPSKGKPSQKQLRTQIRNYRDQLRELEGKPPRFKPKGSVLTRAIGRFQSEVDEGRLSNEERLVLDLIGRVSESDKDVMGIDQKQVANQKKKGVIVKDGLTIDQIVTDFISENDLSEDSAQDLRDYAIDFLSKKDAYEFMKEVKERESTPDPDAIRDDEYYGYGYQLAEDLDMTVEEQDLLESEVAEILLSGKQLTDKQYAELQTQFAEEIESIRSGQETIDKGDDTKKGKGDKIQEDVEIFEQVLTINDTTKLKSSKKAKIKEVVESKADNDIISYIAENIDDIKAQLRDKVGLTTECKW